MEIKTLVIDAASGNVEEVILTGNAAKSFLNDRAKAISAYEATKNKHQEIAENKQSAIAKLVTLGLSETEAAALLG